MGFVFADLGSHFTKGAASDAADVEPYSHRRVDGSPDEAKGDGVDKCNHIRERRVSIIILRGTSSRIPSCGTCHGADPTQIRSFLKDFHPRTSESKIFNATASHFSTDLPAK
jgi:hypothetical protein